MTKLLYLEDMHRLETEATIEKIFQENGRDVILLDQTIFYPQGGGQPYDQGSISNDHAAFQVEEVRFKEDVALKKGIVWHIGKWEILKTELNDESMESRVTSENFAPGEKVHLKIDEKRRVLNSELHTAGHLIDGALSRLQIDFLPTKAYHFPDGPYVEYRGEVREEEKETLRKKIEEEINSMIQESFEVKIQLTDYETMKKLCAHTPENLPTSKPIRIVQVCDAPWIPCGGTHVKNIAAIKSEQISKIKSKDGIVKICYRLHFV